MPSLDLETAGAGPAQTVEWGVSEHSNGRGQFDAGISLSGASLDPDTCCCMCAAEGEVTRAVQLILRQGQICNTEN